MTPLYQRLVSPDSSLVIYDNPGPKFDGIYHYHPEFELSLFCGTKGLAAIGDSIHPISSGDTILLGPNIPHYWNNDGLKLVAPEPRIMLIFKFTEHRYTARVHGHERRKIRLVAQARPRLGLRSLPGPRTRRVVRLPAPRWPDFRPAQGQPLEGAVPPPPDATGVLEAAGVVPTQHLHDELRNPPVQVKLCRTFAGSP